jgi:signal transduction histidine kinase
MIALTAIQGYFIYNTFILKKREAQTAVRAELIKMEQNIHIDQLRSNWFKNIEYLVKENRYSDIDTLVSNCSAVISRQISTYIDNNKILDQYHTAYEVIIQNAVLINKEASYKLVLKNKLWFSNGKPLEEPQIIHDLTTSDNSLTSPVIQDFNTRSHFSINDWQRNILGQMTGLLFFSVILLGFVMLLFYFSIKNLIKQKKIADMQTDFINNITHEFNTPLATLSVAVSTIKGQPELRSNSIINNAVQGIERQHIRLKKLIDQVMTHTADVRQLVLKKGNISITHFLLQIIADFRATNSGTELIERLQKEDVIIPVDSFYLTTAISNILENAIKYGGTKLIITAAVEGSFYQIAIFDNGIGIAQIEQEKIFEKFYRVEKGDIHTVKGLGLGLFYSQQLIAAHGGRIKVQSIPDKGSTFTIILPLL